MTNLGTETDAAAAVTLSRRHDLDALRAFAMLLGILLHGIMSFIPGIGAIWAVQDSQASPWFGLLLSFIHGWRMPLFFLVSGFFTAMLWRKRGLHELLRHRFKRIFLPLLLGLLTIIPLTWIVSGYVRLQPVAANASGTADLEGSKADGSQIVSVIDIWAAVATAEQDSVQEYLADGGDIEAKDPNGSTPLHVACFFGQAKISELLLKSGASLTATNNDGKRPDELLLIDWGTTAYIAQMFQLPVDRDQLLAGRQEIAEMIGQRTGSKVASLPIDGQDSASVGQLINLLMYFPLFHHLWFLWFLCWYVCGFALLVNLLHMLHVPAMPSQWLSSRRRFLWLIPLTAVSQYSMARTPGAFGPDTSIGLLPIPAVLAYYAVFFGFGVLYFDADDREVAVGRGFWWMLAVAVVVLFPVGLSLQASTSEGAKMASSIAQAGYAWCMSFGMIGLFHRHFHGHNSWLRYLSDSSYWLYLAHIPLIIYVQFLVRDQPLPSGLKAVIVCAVTTGLLLLSYHLFVRKTWLGVLLNGRRHV